MQDPSRHPPAERGYRSLRRGRVSIPGQCYLLSFVVDGRRPVFLDPAHARAASRTLNRRGLWKDSELLAWVIMPDHAHLLARLGGSDRLQQLVTRIRAAISREVRSAGSGVGSLWQSGFHDRAVRSDEDLRAVARYVVANPLRAGVVEVLADYPYWDATWMEQGSAES